MLVPSAALLTTVNSLSFSLSTECDQQLKCHNLHLTGNCSSMVYASLKQYASIARMVIITAWMKAVAEIEPGNEDRSNAWLCTVYMGHSLRQFINSYVAAKY